MQWGIEEWKERSILFIHLKHIQFFFLLINGIICNEHRDLLLVNNDAPVEASVSLSVLTVTKWLEMKCWLSVFEYTCSFAFFLHEGTWNVRDKTTTWWLFWQHFFPTPVCCNKSFFIWTIVCEQRVGVLRTSFHGKVISLAQRVVPPLTGCDS